MGGNHEHLRDRCGVHTVDQLHDPERMGASGRHSMVTNHQRGAALGAKSFRQFSYPVFGYGGIDACGMGQTGEIGSTMHSGLDIVLTLTSPSPPPYSAKADRVVRRRTI
eukprot:5127550-Pyramimonas_sp.AAC.1